MRFDEDEDSLANSPMRRIKPPSLDRELLPAFTAEEAGTNGTDPRSLRDRGLIDFMLYTGCRLAEVGNMILDDMD